MAENSDGTGNDKDEDQDEGTRLSRLRGQISIIQDAFGEENVGIGLRHPRRDDPADVDYLYHQRRVLVRDADLPRLLGLLRDEHGVRREPDIHGLIDGVTRVGIPERIDLVTFLRATDQRFGIGVVTPDHILYVTGGKGGLCPATEPELVEGTVGGPEPVWWTKPEWDGAGVLVSVVDTGWYRQAALNPATPWLKGVTGDPEHVDPADIPAYAGHGTFIAGVVRGVAPKADVRIERFLTKGGAITESKMIAQLGQALRRGPDIISLSAGTSTRRDQRLLSFQVFWETQLQHLKGTVLVAAAGNDGSRVPFWPAAFPWSVSVGAFDAAKRRAKFSNFGSWVDVYARGVDLVNAFPTGHYTYKEPRRPGRAPEVDFDGLARWSGTSFSTPVVSGMIAARMSGRGESARIAATGLLRHARQQSIKGLGPWLQPDRASYQSPE
jgi:subtilisin family serine protease